MSKKFTFLSSFWLKIIALATMTIDHIAVALQAFYPSMPNLNNIYPIFRCIGRIAMPLFCFMIVEGVLHTKNIKKYFLRLGIIGLAVLIAELALEYIPAFGMQGFAQDQGNIFIDLILGALAVWALNHKNNWFKLFAIIPIAIGICSAVAYSLESANHYIIYWMPFFLRTQYNIVSIALMIGFYLIRMLVNAIYEQAYGLKEKAFEDTASWRIIVNLISAAWVCIVAISWYAVSWSIPSRNIFWMVDFQNYMMFAGIAILLYSGLRGYNAKWFKYGCYLYYPLHIVIIYLVMFLITL